MRTLDAQDAGMPVRLEVDPGCEALAQEEGQDVVAVHAASCRHVDLDPVARTEELFEPPTLEDERVERAQQCAT